MNGSIANNTMLFRVNFGILGNSKQVRANVVLKTDANTKLLKIQKTLLESPELEAIKKADGAMRTFLYENCLPHPDMGIMILPNALLGPIEAKLSEYGNVTRPNLVADFVTMYPQRIAEAKEKTAILASEIGVAFSDLWIDSAYPSPDTVAFKFSFDWQYLTFATPEALPDILKAKENEKAIAKMNQAAEEITLLMRQTLLELVTHLKQALEPSADGKQKRFHATSVTNIHEFLATFKARNVTDDKQLEALAEQVSNLLSPDMDIDFLKTDDAFKASILSGMDSLGSQLNELVEEIPGRKFKQAL